MTEMQKILSDRKDKYGDFRYQADLSISLKHAMREGNAWYEMQPYMHEALDMIQHKIARILNGDPYYEDSWVDIIGYAQLALDRIREDNENFKTVEAFQKWVEKDGSIESTVTVGGSAVNSDEIAQVLRHNGVGGGTGKTEYGSTTVTSSTMSEFNSR